MDEDNAGQDSFLRYWILTVNCPQARFRFGLISFPLTEVLLYGFPPAPRSIHSPISRLCKLAGLVVFHAKVPAKFFRWIDENWPNLLIFNEVPLKKSRGDVTLFEGPSKVSSKEE